MASLYLRIGPYDYGMLDVGDGHLVYWETCGDPFGKPALVLDGGPIRAGQLPTDFTGLVIYYWYYNCWLEDGALLRDANRRLSGILAS